MALSHLSLTSFYGTLANSAEPGSALFAYRMCFSNLNETEINYPTTLNFEMDSSD